MGKHFHRSIHSRPFEGSVAIRQCATKRLRQCLRKQLLFIAADPVRRGAGQVRLHLIEEFGWISRSEGDVEVDSRSLQDHFNSDECVSIRISLGELQQNDALGTQSHRFRLLARSFRLGGLTGSFASKSPKADRLVRECWVGTRVGITLRTRLSGPQSAS